MRARGAAVGRELDDAVLFQRYLFSSHERVARLVRGAAAAPAMVDLLLGYVTGAMSYGSLRRRVIFKFPGTIWRVAREKFSARRMSPSAQE